MNQDRVNMKRMQEEIQQTYQTPSDLAPYSTLFCLLEKHNLGRLAYQFMNAREPYIDRNGFDNYVDGHDNG
jgi:hypothetical protein